MLMAKNGIDRKTLKRARELIQGTRKLLRVNRDVLDARRAGEISTSCAQLEAAVAARDAGDIRSASQTLEKQLDRAFPRPKYAGLRENVEVLLVAVIVAMAVRTFFVQPFKIPTGSMQPTLFGIYPYRDNVKRDPPLPYERGKPSLPEQLLGMIFGGRIYESDGYRVRGDHIFVDRFSYHFRKPKRGEVVVFDTSDIDTSRIPDLAEQLHGKFYIKRLIGLARDTVRINPPYVLVNGKALDDRQAFRRIYSKRDGYNGYILPDYYLYPKPTYLNTKNPSYTIPDNHLFVLGDNSASSLDGRFWGSFPKKDLIGRAVAVYWPFTKRFGLVD